MKHEIIYNKEIGNLLAKELVEQDYQYIKNPYTEGDNDILVVDTKEKQFTFFENGCGINHEELIKNYLSSSNDIIELFN